MNNLNSDLRSAMAQSFPELGGARKLDVQPVRKALNRAVTHNNQVFWILVVMICALFVFQMVLFVIWAAQPVKAAAVATASGVSLPFLLYFLRDSWRTKVQADTLLALATSLDPAIVQSIVKAFLDGVAAPSGAGGRVN